MNRPPHHLSDEELSAHTDGRLDRPAIRAAEQHLAACDECARRGETLASARAFLRGTTVAPVDDLTRRRLVTRAMATGARDARPNRVRLLAVAAVALVAVGGVALLEVSADREIDMSGDVVLGLPIRLENMAAGVGGLEDPAVVQSALLSSENPAMAVEGGTGGASGSGRALEFEESGPADSADAPASAGQSDGVPPQAVTRGVLPATAAPSEADTTAIARCYTAVRPSTSDDNRLTAALVGMYGDRPVIVLGFRSESGRVLAMVLGREECDIIVAHTFR